MSAKLQRLPTDEDKIRAIRLVYNRLHRAFTLYHWACQILPMLTDHPQCQESCVAIVTVKNACIETTLLSVRDIDDFFRPQGRRSHEHDLRATDFYGFQSPGPFLSAAERESINQRIAHLTFSPIWTGTSGLGSDPTYNWDSAELVGRAARAVFAFMDHIDTELSSKRPADADEFRKVKTVFEGGLTDLEALAAIERRARAKA